MPTLDTPFSFMLQAFKTWKTNKPEEMKAKNVVLFRFFQIIGFQHKRDDDTYKESQCEQ